eukprot:2335812-Prymnesium_polylepis.1
MVPWHCRPVWYELPGSHALSPEHSACKKQSEDRPAEFQVPSPPSIVSAAVGCAAAPGSRARHRCDCSASAQSLCSSDPECMVAKLNRNRERDNIGALEHALTKET